MEIGALMEIIQHILDIGNNALMELGVPKQLVACPLLVINCN
jgi:hypothetical protein